MIDYIKFNTELFDYELMLRHENIKWRNITDEETGFLIRREGGFRCMELILYDSRLVIKFPLHRFYNELVNKISSNYNRITFQEVNQMLTYIEELFNLDLTKCVITRLEFGFNIMTQSCPTKLIEEGIIYYGGHGVRYPSDENYGKKGYLKSVKFGEYEIKIYDKGKKHDLSYDLLRFEIKAFKSRNLREQGIRVVSDLFNPRSQICLYYRLKKALLAFLIIDCNEMNVDAYEKYQNLFNLHLSQSRMASWKKGKSNQALGKSKKRVKEVLEMIGLDKSHKFLMKELNSEFFKYLNTEVAVFTSYIALENYNLPDEVPAGSSGGIQIVIPKDAIMIHVDNLKCCA